jgi:hypothetical protein
MANAWTDEDRADSAVVAAARAVDPRLAAPVADGAGA